jgi:hypothetical protein
VLDAFLNEDGVFPEAEQLAAKQAIAAALRRRAPSTGWAEKQGDGDGGMRVAGGLARALAVACALDDRRSPGVASGHATRDRDIALRRLQRRIGREKGLREKVHDECGGFDEVLPPLPGGAASVLRGVAPAVKRLVTAAIVVVAGPGRPRMLDPDPWWVPSPAAAGGPAAQRESLSDEARVSLLASLLTVHSTQFSSYTSLLWQVPALSLTAQAFLLTLALSHGNDNLAKLIASALSMLIAIASSRLMRNQRNHAKNHGELALRISRELRLASQFGTLNVAEPPGADAETVWAGWDRRIYGVWRATLISFLIADMVVIFSVILSATPH